MPALEAMLREAKEQRRREREEWMAQRDAAREIKYASRGGVQFAGKENARPTSPTSASTSACQIGRRAHHATSKGNPVSIVSSKVKPLAEICKNSSASAARNSSHRVPANISTKCYGSLSSSTILMLEMWEDRARMTPLGCTDEASTNSDDTCPSEDKTRESGDACQSKLWQSLFEWPEAVAIEEPTDPPQTLSSSRADVERLRVAVERLATSGEASAEPELRRLRRQLCKYVFPREDAEKRGCDVKSVLKDDDILSRAFDITIFQFFDARCLAYEHLVKMGQFPDTSEKLAPICEYPPGWRQWEIHSFDLREAICRDRYASGRRFKQVVVHPLA